MKVLSIDSENRRVLVDLPDGAGQYSFEFDGLTSPVVITHNLGRIPASIAVVDSAGTAHLPGIVHVDLNEFQFSLEAGPYSGTVHYS